MRSILVVNPKGGSGKTTIATNLAGFFAAHGKRVVLADMDRQQSAATWLARRPETVPHIKPGPPTRTKKTSTPTMLTGPSSIRRPAFTVKN